MKAYEFYVLLGKYKKKHLTLPEYERFQLALRKSRSYRYAFYDATGEQSPSYTPIPKGRYQQKQQSGEPAEENVEKKSLENIPRTEPETVRERNPHRRFVRVKSSRSRRSRYRWWRLTRDLIRDNSILFSLVIILSVGFLVYFFRNTLWVDSQPPAPVSAATRNAKESPLADPPYSREALSSEKDSNTTRADRSPSQSDLNWQLNSSTFELRVDPTMDTTVPIIGLDQALQEGMEAMFIDPKTALDELRVPDL